MSDKIYIVYTTHCPKCNVLEKKLKDANIGYTSTDDIQPIIDAGFLTAPVLYDSVKQKYYTFSEAVKFINEYDNDTKDDDTPQSFGGCATCML